MVNPKPDQPALVRVATVARLILILTTLFAIGLFLVALRSDSGDNQIKLNTAQLVGNQQRLDHLTTELKRSVHGQCEDSQASARGVNTILDALIRVNKKVVVGPATSQAEIDARIKMYVDAKMKTPECRE